MIIPVNGRNYTMPELLIYWIQERHDILTKRMAGQPKPWSKDPVFQNTYFCNVRREDDKVTQFIRKFYSPHVEDRMFEYNIIFSRFINWPPTIEVIKYMQDHDPEWLLNYLDCLASNGKIWGNAYVITTHGIPMPKAAYLCRNVLGGVYRGLDALRKACRGPSLALAAEALEGFEGVGPFLAGQVVADLKNTPGHPLASADDWWEFVMPGPGSIRGASWVLYGKSEGVTYSTFQRAFQEIREYVDHKWVPEMGVVLHSQDLQNCLCEFDKYCRVTTGSGRSKRGYAGGA